MSSVPPPSVPPPARTSRAPAPELALPLERDGDVLRLCADKLSLQHAGVMHSALELPLGAVKVAAVGPGPATVAGQQGRFAILRRIGPTRVIPREEGIEGWLWTSTGGTGLTSLDPAGRAPNVALVFTKPIDEARLRAAFEPAFVAALAARSPLGTPSMLGVLFRVADTLAAEQGFRRWGFQAVLTDKEIPPTLRRHLPTDRPADPVARRTSDDPRGATSVAPPGFS